MFSTLTNVEFIFSFNFPAHQNYLTIRNQEFTFSGRGKILIQQGNCWNVKFSFAVQNVLPAIFTFGLLVSGDYGYKNR